MQISRLEISNFVGISELKIDLGKVNSLSGRCGAGKTSVIEAIEKGFSNKNQRVEVVRHGASNATIFIKTDTGLEIDRRIRSTKSDYLRVRKSGEAVPSTEKYLKQFLSGEIFRPLEFCSKSPNEQAKIILNLLEIPWSLDDISTWFGEIPDEINYDEHILQVIHQIVGHYFSEGYKNELPQNFDGNEWRSKKIADYYKVVTDADALNQLIAATKSSIEGHEGRLAIIKAESEMQQQSKANEMAAKRNDIETLRQDLRHNITLADNDIAKLGERLVQSDKELDKELELEIQKLKEAYTSKKAEARETIQAQVNAMERQAMDFHKKLHGLDVEFDSLGELERTTLAAISEKADEKIQAELNAAQETQDFLKENAPVDVEPLRKAADEVAHMQSYLRDFDLMTSMIKDKLAPREERSSVLTARIEKGRKLPQELLKIAAVPVPGLSVDSDGLIRIGQTLIDGLSEGEQLELAFRVAKAQASELKLICLDGWNKLNPAARAWIEKEIATDEFQYIVTTTEDGDLAITISEGPGVLK